MDMCSQLALLGGASRQRSCVPGETGSSRMQRWKVGPRVSGHSFCSFLSIAALAAGKIVVLMHIKIALPVVSGLHYQRGLHAG